MASYIPLLSYDTLNEKMKGIPARQRVEPIRLLKQIEALKNDYRLKKSDMDFETYSQQSLELTDQFYEVLREATEAYSLGMDAKSSSPE